MEGIVNIIVYAGIVTVVEWSDKGAGVMSQHPNPSRSTSQASKLSMEPHLPTHIAAFHDDVQKLRRLIEEEGAPLSDEESLETPLHVAARWYVTIE